MLGGFHLIAGSETTGGTGNAGRSDASAALDLKVCATYPRRCKLRVIRSARTPLLTACGNWDTVCKPTVKLRKAAATWIGTHSFTTLMIRPKRFSPQVSR